MNVLATQRGSAHYPSMLEDVEARRPTEIDLITGSLVREAGKHGVPVPLHTALYRLVKAKEASWRDEPRPHSPSAPGGVMTRRKTGALAAMLASARRGRGGRRGRACGDERPDRDRLGVRRQGQHGAVRRPGARGGATSG